MANGQKYHFTMKMFFFLFLLMWNEQEGALAVQGCGSVVNNTLKSPEYPKNYPNNMDCNYSVPIPQGMKMTVVVNYFKLEYEESCSYDYLQVTIKSNQKSSFQKKYCGVKSTENVIPVPAGDSVVFTFHTDKNNQEKGFHFTFLFSEDGTLTECGSVVNNILKSPGYPKNYPNNMDCNYSVPIPQGMKITIVFNYFQLEDQESCSHDYLQVTIKSNQKYSVHDTYCGDRRKKVDQIHVPAGGGGGCGSVVNNTLKSPGYPNGYPTFMDCDFLVPIPQNMTMNISFIYFDLEAESSCGYDYLKVINDRGEVVSIHCGQMKTRHDVFLTGDYVVMTFHSADDEMPKRGFLIYFTAVPLVYGCNPLINNTLKSPGYPNNYPNNTDCTSSVPIPQGMMMHIYFIEFDLEYSTSCHRDYLKITNEKHQEFGRDVYCGQQTGKTVLVAGKYALLNFHSDSNVQKRGFVMYFYCCLMATRKDLGFTLLFLFSVPATLQATTEITHRNDEPTQEEVIVSKTITYFLASVASILFLVVCFVLGFWWYRKLHHNGVNRSTCPVREIIPLDKWELLPEQIEYEEELGRGAFGVVYKATLKKRVGIDVFDTGKRLEPKEACQVVAVKVLQDGYKCPFLPGECDLQDENQSPADTDSMLAGSSFQNDEEIAMYLSENHLAEKGFIHRDLAARNILVGCDDRVKVSDFGLMRQIYEDVYNAKKTKNLPVKWMAPESIFDNDFTIKSDTWSYGILLWEMATLGGFPYPTLTNPELCTLLKTGYRMERPDMYCDEIYELMCECWSEDPATRPSFSQLIDRLEVIMTRDVPYCDVSRHDESSPYYNVPAKDNSD
ncbi:hypothetical protein OS493_007174 [Desmophyllum pertusum]|uniref:Uncharacterized protein n=1 Tax=Desmophyllum pertusum TaxID=174260 RepID=A0A9W9ZFN2_9CNID|nr:hypothetical protein OS493_007174 [Desmophyllum pertusum]